MGIYIIFFILLITIPIIFIVWIIRLILLYKKGKKKRTSFNIQASILLILVIVITWELRIFPLSENFYIWKRTEELTGQSFWVWKKFSFGDLSVRGEGYSIGVYKFNKRTSEYFKNPDSVFFNLYPQIKEIIHPNDLIKWKPTPVIEVEQDELEFVTPNYVGWSEKRLNRMEFVKKLANTEGSYYSFFRKADIDFFIVAPKERLLIIINHNM